MTRSLLIVALGLLAIGLPSTVRAQQPAGSEEEKRELAKLPKKK